MESLWTMRNDLGPGKGGIAPRRSNVASAAESENVISRLARQVSVSAEKSSELGSNKQRHSYDI